MHFMAPSDKTDLEKLGVFLRANFRLDQRIEAINNRKIYSLEIELTRRCNLECNYCYNSSSRSPGIPDFDFNLLKRVLREAYDYGIRSITYLGGEPTLHPELKDIIKFTKTIGMEEVVLYTNGTLLDDVLLEVINEYVDSIVIHLDSVDKIVFSEVHDIDIDTSYRFHESILRNIHILKSSGYDSKQIRLCLTLFRSSYESLEKTLRWAIHEEGMLTSIFIPVVPSGKGTQITSKNQLSLNEIQDAYNIRAKIENRRELLTLGTSEYFKQYQLTVAYITSHGDRSEE